MSGNTAINSVRAVHLDFKGVPPTFDRLLRLLDLFGPAGYNAVLVEWEDMFPWTVDPRFRCETAYTPKQIEQFHAEAADRNLQIIPLIQCLGNMETPLSVDDYIRLREVPHMADVINSLADGSRQLLEKMMDDVLSLTPTPHYFHLGGAGAPTLGTHPDTRAYIAKHGAAALYLHHVEPLFDKLQALNIRPIVWHDMMRRWDLSSLRRVADKADLMLWGYRGHPDSMGEHCDHALIDHFKAAHLTLWGATAYKGADGGADSDLPDPAARAANALAWVQVSRRDHFAGLVATACSRNSAHRPQKDPIDSALDCLFLVGTVLCAARVPSLAECAETLDKLGELARFEKCRALMQQLADARTMGWESIRLVRQEIVVQEQDPRRRDVGALVHLLQELQNSIRVVEQIAHDMRATFAGLIDPIWIDRYVGGRVEPLREEFANLNPRVHALDPAAHSAGGL